MDAIKKKMLAMKMDKENALDRAEQLDQKYRDTEVQKSKVCTAMFLALPLIFPWYFIYI